jgi:hypothetical protein
VQGNIAHTGLRRAAVPLHANATGGLWLPPHREDTR